MKHFFRLMLSTILTALLLTSASAVSASTGTKNVSLTFRGIRIVVGDTLITPKDGSGNAVEPFILGGSTYLPVRAVAGALGLEAGWDGDTSTVTLTSGKTPSPADGTPLSTTGVRSASITYRDIKLVIDGASVTPKDPDGRSVEPFLYSGNTYLPVRAVAGALNVDVSWDGATSTVYLGSLSGEAPEDAPAADHPIVYGNTAPGAKTSKNSAGTVTVDYSNASSGYVMVASKVTGNPKLVVRVTGPTGTKYDYFFTDTTGVYQAYPLTEGNGSYKISVFQNISGTKYNTLHSVSVDAALSSSLAPFLRPNIFVNYSAATKCVKTASTLCAGCETELAKVDAVYYYVVNNYSYDHAKADTVTTGYVPKLDEVYASKTGICFDYAATMAAMLRTQGVATKLVVGYAGSVYHAWINVYTTESGWVEAVVYFDGNTWKLMDPTFASTGKDSAQIKEFISNPSNYSAKYIY